MSKRLLLLTAASALAAAALCPAAPAATSATLGPVAADTPMSAAGGWVVWSQPDAAGAWHLVTWHAGATAQLPVAPRSVPFDADAGTDAHGRPVILFSRCAKEPDMQDPQPWSTARGCRLRVADPATGAERAAGVPELAGSSDSTPSEWHGRIAFQRRALGAPVAQIERYDPTTRRLTTLRHGAVPHTCPFRGGCAQSRFMGEVMEMDLGARTLAFSWRVEAPSVIGVGLGWEMRAERLTDERMVLAGNGYLSGACGGRFPVSPNATSGGLWFLSRRLRCDGVEGSITSTTFTSPTLAVAHAPQRVAWRIARDGATTYAVLGPGHVGQGGAPLFAPAALELVRLDGVKPQPTGKRADGPFF